MGLGLGIWHVPLTPYIFRPVTTAVSMKPWWQVPRRFFFRTEDDGGRVADKGGGQWMEVRATREVLEDNLGARRGNVNWIEKQSDRQLNCGLDSGKGCIWKLVMTARKSPGRYEKMRIV